jgi:hypothetical protein
MEDVLVRLAQLERENRRWKAGAIAGAAAALGFLLVAAAPAPRKRVVEVTELRLIDPTGALRGSLSADKAGAQLVLKDGTGKNRARLRVADDGAPRLELLDRMERVRLGAALDKDGAAQAHLDDESGHPRVKLASAIDGSPSIDLADAAKTRASISVEAEGTAGLAVFDADGAARARTGVTADGSPAVKLIDADGTLRASLGTIALKEAGSGAAERTQPGSLVLFDKKGAVVFKQPK